MSYLPVHDEGAWKKSLLARARRIVRSGSRMQMRCASMVRNEALSGGVFDPVSNTESAETAVSATTIFKRWCDFQRRATSASRFNMGVKLQSAGRYEKLRAAAQQHRDRKEVLSLSKPMTVGAIFKAACSCNPAARKKWAPQALTTQPSRWAQYPGLSCHPRQASGRIPPA